MVISWFHLEIFPITCWFVNSSKVAARKIGFSPAMNCMLNWTFICFQPAKSDHIWLDSWSTNHWWHVLNSVHIFYTLQIVQSLLSKCSFNKTIFVRLVTISMYSLTCRKCRVRGILRYLLLLSGGEQSMCHFFCLALLDPFNSMN